MLGSNLDLSDLVLDILQCVLITVNMSYSTLCVLSICMCILHNVPVWLSGRALRQQRKRLWVRFSGNTQTDKKCIT